MKIQNRNHLKVAIFKRLFLSRHLMAMKFLEQSKDVLNSLVDSFFNR